MPSQGIIRCPVEAVWNGRPGTAPCVSSKYNNCREDNFSRQFLLCFMQFPVHILLHLVAHFFGRFVEYAHKEAG